MQQKIMLQIPTPCHENWNNLDATTQNQPGKFCGSCQKNVVDFTNMSDAQVLAYFSTNKSNTCGRFENDQLNRVLATPPPPKKSWYKWMMAALVSGFIFSNKAKAQTNAKVGEVQTCQTNNGRELMGDTIMHRPIRMGKTFFPSSAQQNPKYILRGTVTDEKGKPLLGASVIVKNSKLGAATDIGGRFSIPYNSFNNEPVLVISSVGYAVEERKMDLMANKESIDANNIVLKPTEIMLSQNVVVGGYVLVKHPTKKTNKVVDTLRSVLPKFTTSITDKLIVSPNPAKAGSSINLTFCKAGEYQVQLFNLQSMMLYNQKIAIAIDGAKAPFVLPASLAASEYFIRAINDKSNMQMSGKLIVQY